MYAYYYRKANPAGDDLNLLLARKRTGLQPDLNRHRVREKTKKVERIVAQRQELAMAEAARRGRTENVRMLLEIGADLNLRTKDRQGNTPLHLACSYGHRECVRVMLENGAMLGVRNEIRQRTALPSSAMDTSGCKM